MSNSKDFLLDKYGEEQTNQRFWVDLEMKTELQAPPVAVDKVGSLMCSSIPEFIPLLIRKGRLGKCEGLTWQDNQKVR